MLDCPGADPAVGLPEADSVVVSSRGQDDRVAAHRPLVHIHADCWLPLRINVRYSQLLQFSSQKSLNVVKCQLKTKKLLNLLSYCGGERH